MKKYITLEQYISDAEQIILLLRKRFNKDKIFLLGESWGSVVGMHLIQRHPEWFYAYIGASQVANVPVFINDMHSYALENAQKEHNAKAIKELNKTGIPTKDMSSKRIMKSIIISGKWKDYYISKEYNLDNSPAFFFQCLFEAKEYSLIDFKNTLMGYKSTMNKKGQCYLDITLDTQIAKVSVPVYFIMGEYDILVKFVKQYFDILQAPKKKLYIINGTGHYVRGDKHEEFDQIVYNTVLPENYTDNK